ncbi:MAG TPA: hypothetical protein VJ001_18340 [Rhodocyclaceae bacterium]|nr:hypothetical protein [Rhodocyclaceae bacterium]
MPSKVDPGEPLETLHAALQKFTIFVVEHDWAKFNAWVEWGRLR